MSIADIKKQIRFSAAEMRQFPSDLHPIFRTAIDCTADVLNAVQYSNRVILKGPPGTGKSTIASTWGHNREVERFTITPETCAGELFGRSQIMPDNGGMKWVPGYCARAWLGGKRTCIDEIHESSGDSVPFLHMFLDDSKMAFMTTPDGQTIRPGEGFSVVATTNAEYEAIPEALLDRFVVRRHVGKPNPQLLLSLPQAIRVAAAYGLFAPNPPKEIASLTTRSWVEMGRLMHVHGLSTQESFEVILGASNAKAASLAVDAANAKALADQAAKMAAELE